MHISAWRFSLCSIAVFSTLAIHSRAQPSNTGVLPQPLLALTHASVVDVQSGQIACDATVVVRDGRIASIVFRRRAGSQIIDLKGKYLLPGLMDAHTHLDTLAAARRALVSGVTTVRSASVGSFRDVAIREIAKAGYIACPDMLAAGVFVTPASKRPSLRYPGFGSLAAGVHGAEALRKAVQVNLAHGVDVIKTRGTERAGTPDTDPREQVYTEEELRVIVEEAAKKDVPILAHAHGEEGARAAVNAGVRSIEHGTYLSEDTLRLMKQKGTFLVPTYSTTRRPRRTGRRLRQPGRAQPGPAHDSAGAAHDSAGAGAGRGDCDRRRFELWPGEYDAHLARGNQPR